MKKTLITILCTVLVCSCVMGVTLAFLMDKTDPITNTFTVGKVDIELNETAGTLVDGSRTFKMIPGSTLAKDPVVTVKAGSEKCYLFVTVAKSTDFDKYIESAMVNTWKAVPNTTNVYYIEVANSNVDQPFPILSGSEKNPNGEVTVVSTLTSADMNYLNANNPTITFTAYAVQQDNLTVQEAWTQAQDSANYSATVTPTT